MQASTDEMRLLAQIGFWGASRGHAVAAKAIFSAIEAQRPMSLAAFVGPAMADLYRGRASEAVACLERGEAIVSRQDRPALYAFLGLAHRASGQNAHSNELLRRAGDVTLAQALLAASAAGGLSVS